MDKIHLVKATVRNVETENEVITALCIRYRNFGLVYNKVHTIFANICAMNTGKLYGCSCDCFNRKRSCLCCIESIECVVSDSYNLSPVHKVEVIKCCTVKTNVVFVLGVYLRKLG